jgi:hypothetical protein
MTGPDRNPCKTLLPSFALGLTTLAFIIAKTGRDALFFQGGGLLQLPLIYINIGMPMHDRARQRRRVSMRNFLAEPASK